VKKLLKNYKKYLFDREFFPLLLVSITTLVIASVSNLVQPKIVSNIIDHFEQTGEIKNSDLVIAGIVLISATIFTFLQTHLNNIFGEKIGKDLKNRLFEKILKHNYNFLIEKKPSKLLTIINVDTVFVKNVLAQSVGLILAAIFLLTGSLFLMYSISPTLSTIIVVVVPLIVVLLLLILKNKFKLFKKIQILRDGMNRVINENIKASMLIKVFVSEKSEIAKFEKVNSKTKDVGIELARAFAIAIPVISAINFIGAIIIIYFGGIEIIKDRMSIGDLTAFMSYVQIFTIPILILGLISTGIGQAIASISRINEILDTPVDTPSGEDRIKRFKSLEFKDVSLKIDKKKILGNIDFKIKKGEKVGIIGLTGSGKTIFLKHIIRALEPTSGEILINGKDIKEYDIKDLRERIGFAFQENYLFNGTILENIRFGRKISKKETMKYAKIALVDEFASNFKKKYNSNVGEQGSKLSGGQKQRIMIARALAGKPKLLILDDATSRLDIPTEKQVIENILKEFKDITIIFVSQKISSVKDFDEINIFHEGRISHKGTHKKLLKESLLYQEIELTQRNHEH
jgi:ATP-binding cassette, subfamily B, bacterial